MNRSCSEIALKDFEKITELNLSTSTAAEKCNRPEVIYKNDLKHLHSVTALNISRNLLTQAEALQYLNTRDNGRLDQQNQKTDRRFGPCVMYSDLDRKTWDQMWAVIDKRTAASISDIAENFLSVVSYFPKIRKLKVYPININEPIEPIIKSLKYLEHIDACPNSLDSHNTIFNQIQNLNYLKLESCFLVSKAPHPPTLEESLSLKKLIIKENNWTFQDSNYFSKVPNIEFLDLSRNNFAKLPVGLFLPLKKLKKINFKGHKFTKSEKQRIRDELIASSPGLSRQNSIIF